MKSKLIFLIANVVSICFFSCNTTSIELNDNLKSHNRNIVLEKNTISLDKREGDGLVVFPDHVLESGTVRLKIKGENKPGESFVGLAFNIQNDSTYEVIYFRPFNFKAKTPVQRERSIQYVSLPEYTWDYLRTHFENQYESEYFNAPFPEDWFEVSIKIESDMIRVYNRWNTELLSVIRLNEQTSDRFGLWVGNNSKGSFKSIQIIQ